MGVGEVVGRGGTSVADRKSARGGRPAVVKPSIMFERSLPLSIATAALVSLAACSASNQNPGEGGGGNGNGAGGPGGHGQGGENLGNGGNGQGGIGEACGSTSFANQVPGTILIVLDKSGSMAGGDGVPDKWAPTVQALKTMMAAASPDLQMGLLPFPAGNFNDAALLQCGLNPSDPACAAIMADSGCEDVATSPVVPPAALSTTQGAISNWLDNNDPGGNTPTLTALKNAYSYLQNIDVPGERFVLLMTDGIPTEHTPAMTLGPFTFPESAIKCGVLGDIESLAGQAAGGAPQIKTFVIGSPGSEGAGQFLSQLAVNGLTQKSPGCSPSAKDCHYQIGQANFQQDLEMVLNEITGKISECVFALPAGEDVDPDYVNVVVETANGEDHIYKDTSHTDGWDYTDDTHTKVELYGPACESFKAEKGAKVNIVLGCKTIIK